jgi:hypothetical protein
MPATNQYNGVGAGQADRYLENEYGNVDALLSNGKSHYQDWKAAENPAPAHYDKIDVVEHTYGEISDIK